MENGGYDYKFVDTPSDTLICQICHCPSKEPHLSVCCGHTFCKSCLEAAKGVIFVTNSCPICRNEHFVTVPNKQANRIIRSLYVYCSNKKKGCEWQGEMNAITNHLNNRGGCQFQEVNCPNDCGLAYQRQHLTSHVETECLRRKANCQYCHDTGEHQFIEGQHKDYCPKLPLPCPNKCEIDNISRDGLREHINICSLQLIQCKYHVVGCEAIIARKDQKVHNKEMMEEHLSLSLNELATTKVSMEKKLNEHQSLAEQLLANQNYAQKTIDDLNKKLANAEKEITTLKQQLATLTDNNNKTLTKVEMNFQSKTTELESKLQPLGMMSCYWIGYLDTQATKMLSGNEVIPVVVKMSGFSKKKRQHSEWFSEPFYTHSNGYKLQLKVLPNDTGFLEVFHLSLCLYIVKGPYDERLQWPMKGEYEVRLLNQNSDSMHHSVTCSINEENSEKPTATRNPLAFWYGKKFISHKDLYTTNRFLIKDDKIYIQVCKPLH